MLWALPETMLGNPGALAQHNLALLLSPKLRRLLAILFFLSTL